MAFKNAQKSRALLGKLHLSGYTRKIDGNVTVDQLDVTTLLDQSKVFIPGQDSSDFALDLLLDTDTTAGGEWDTITTWKGTPQVLSYGWEGWSAGSPVILVQANEGQLSPSSTPGAAVSVGINAQTDGGSDFGASLEDLAAITQDTDGTARDNGAATANGGVAHLHVTAFSGLTDDVITIEHSVDGSTSWATLVTFATVSGTTSERVVVAAATTVRRYLRVVDNVTGTGSITRQVSFARR